MVDGLLSSLSMTSRESQVETGATWCSPSSRGSFRQPHGNCQTVHALLQKL